MKEIRGLEIPTIKVWLLPKLSEGDFKALHRAIVEAVEGVKVLGFSGEESMHVAFPPDRMKYGLGTEAVIEVGLRDEAERTWAVLKDLAKRVSAALTLVKEIRTIKCTIFIRGADAKISSYEWLFSR